MSLAGHHICTAAMAPVLLFQGFNARNKALKLPEPVGERTGSSGKGQRLDLLILGDSAAAGVGAKHQDQALSGHIVRGLADHFAVRWRLFAKTGETTQTTLDKLQQLSNRQFDVVVTSLGVNDVTSGTSIKRWLSLQTELRERLRNELGIRLLVVSSLPMMEKFPALPQPLRWHLGARARRFNSWLAADLENERDCEFVPIDSIKEPELMAEDGFHPGPEAYEIWGRLAVKAVGNAIGRDALLRQHRQISSSPGLQSRPAT